MGLKLSFNAFLIGLVTLAGLEANAIANVLQTGEWTKQEIATAALSAFGQWCAAVTVYLWKTFDADGDGVVDSDQQAILAERANTIKTANSYETN